MNKLRGRASFSIPVGYAMILASWMAAVACPEPCAWGAWGGDGERRSEAAASPAPLTPDTLLAGNQAGARFGSSVSTAGDVNGDGLFDVLVGEPFFAGSFPDAGRVSLYFGSVAGLSAAADWSYEGSQANARVGEAVATAGDVNGDGFSDVVLGIGNLERVEVFYGSASGLPGTASWAVQGDQAESYFGKSVAAAGDVNGDGHWDLVVGAPQYSNGQIYEGRAYLYLGSASGLSASPAWVVESNQVMAGFSWPVCGLGDVNGDGFSDIAVAAYTFDGGEPNEGAVFVFHGSPDGPSSIPDWSAEGNQANAWFGQAISSAGDTNGDGFFDLLVGVPNFTNDDSMEGRAYVFAGSAGGLLSTPVWVAEGDQPAASFGRAVSGAGDFNGDGFFDILVGAYLYDSGQTNEGRASLFLGGAGGVLPVPSLEVDGNQDWAFLGLALSAAGDVDGDGLADIVVGAPEWDGVAVDVGAAWISYGQGLDATPPAAVAVNDGPGADIDVQANGVAIQANWQFTDAESGVAGYAWAIGTSPGATDVQQFTSVGPATSATSGTLSLASGQTYFVAVQATNGVGLSSVAASDGVLVDATPPQGGWVNDGVGADVDVQASSGSLWANWGGFVDPESGVASYAWAIGTSPSAMDVQPFTSVGPATSATSGPLSLASGQTYFVAVQAANGAGVSSVAASDGVLVDTTPPQGGWVNDGVGADVDFQASSGSLWANWGGFADAQSGIAGYAWAIGTTPGGVEIQGFIPVALATDAMATGLALAEGGTYFVATRATNGAGLTSIAVSDGLTVQLPNAPPSEPTALGQFDQSGAAVIPVGGTAMDSAVLLRAWVEDPEGQTVQLQVEAVPVEEGFVGNPTATSTATSSGSLASVVVAGLVQGPYHWRARAVDPAGALSPWVSFGGNGEPDADFAVAGVSNANPDPPSGLTQWKLNGATALSIGAATGENGIIVRAEVSDPDLTMVTLDVELKPLGAAFTGVPDGTAMAPSGAIASVTLSGMAVGGYHWRARARDPEGATSPWIGFGGNPESEADVAVQVVNHAPNIPVLLAQLRLDGSGLPVGAATSEGAVQFQGKLVDLDGDQVRLEIEVRALGDPFAEVPTGVSPWVPNGAAAGFAHDGLDGGVSYRWRARARDVNGATSAWVEWGGNGPEDADFICRTNELPAAPTALAQFAGDGTTEIPAGGTLTSNSVLLRATPHDPDGGSVHVEFEIKPDLMLFDGAATVVSSTVADGVVAEVTWAGLAPDRYRWRARTVDSEGEVSPWVEFSALSFSFRIDPAENGVPDSPTGLRQWKLDGATVVPPGGATREDGILLGGVVSDPEGDLVSLEIEVREAGVAFLGVPVTVSAPEPAGVEVRVAITGLPLGNYHWQARAVDALGGRSGWVECRSRLVHFVRTANRAPEPPAGLEQLDASTLSPIPGGGVASTDAVVLEAVLTDPDGDRVRLEVGVKPYDDLFTGVPSAQGDWVASGSSAGVELSGLAAGEYRWRGRATDAGGESSDWVEFGGAGASDFRIAAPASGPGAGGGFVSAKGGDGSRGPRPRKCLLGFAAVPSGPRGIVVLLISVLVGWIRGGRGTRLGRRRCVARGRLLS